MKLSFFCLFINFGFFINLAVAGVDDFFYQPDSTIYQDPKKYGQKFEEVLFRSDDGTLLMGWFVPANNVPLGQALGTLIHLHGNARNMTSHYTFVNWLPENGYNLFTFDYRGYGRSAGAPSRKGVYEDSLAALRYLYSRDDIDTSKIIVFGQSLGGANAIAMLGGNKFPNVKGLVTDSAFYSYKQIVKDHAGSLGFFADFFTSNDYSPENAVQNISPIPHIIIHGTADAVVPFYHGTKLHELAGKKNSLWTIEGGMHTDALTTYRNEVAPRLLAVFKLWLDPDVLAVPDQTKQ